MKYLKKFNENINEIFHEIEEHLKTEYNSDWFNSELSERVYDYIDSEEAEDYDDNYEEAYKNLSTGAAIEYDLLEVMSNDLIEKFKLEEEELLDGKRNIRDIVYDHLYDTCEWKDKSIFNRRSTEPYKSFFDRAFGNSWGDLPDLGDLKL